MITGAALGIERAQWGLGILGAASISLLVAAGAAALLDWLSVSKRSARLRQLEYPAKPAVLLALIGVATTVTPLSGAQRDWFVAALIFCLAGDVFLMLPGEHTSVFGAGLTSFLVAHVLFVVGITRIHPDLAIAGWALLAVAAVAAVPAAIVLMAVHRSDQPWMVGPVAVYLCALLIMAATAWAGATAHGRWPSNPLLAAGALAFVVSDTLLAFDRFVRPIPGARLVVHVTYHLAVAMIVISLAATA